MGSEIKWYLRPVSIVIAILVVGPFAIPLVWMSPALKRWHKVTVTILVVLLTTWMVIASVEIFKIFLKEIESLQAVMR